MDNKTIYALSTVFGKSGVAIVRISGRNALNAVKYLTDKDSETIKPRYAYFVHLQAIDGTPIDNCLLLYFKAPHSFNGDDIVEIQCHGSKAVISSLLKSLSKIPDFRIAEAGEFSKRAFYNGKIDLTEAEGLADLIDAETSEQQKYALRQMGGELKDLYDGWRNSLVNILSYLEAYIDFPDEEIPENIVLNLENNVFKIKNDIYEHLSQNNYGERLHDGFRVVIVGEPNAGKSSLLNALAHRQAAIVSDFAGTTRDAVDIHLNIGGYPVVFTDTAGLRNTEEPIEKEGVKIAFDRAKEADLIILLVDGKNVKSLNVPDELSDCKSKIIKVVNKSDMISQEQCSSYVASGFTVISAKQKSGISDLIDKISEKIGSNFTQGSSVLITRQRYREILNDVLTELDNFTLNKPIELAAEDVRIAVRQIGKITGRVEVDEILDKIFGSFCIGK